MRAGVGAVLHVRIRYGDDEHAGRARRFNAGRRIFKNKAVCGIRLQSFCRQQKNIRSRLPVPDFRIVSQYDALKNFKPLLVAGNLQVKIKTIRTGCYSLWNSCLMQMQG